MPEIKQTLAYLTINNKHLDRNFRFKIIRSSYSLQKIASVYIKRNYFLANRIEVNSGDEIFISLQNNKEDKILVFSGTVHSTSTTSHEIHLEAGFECVKDEVFEETYKDTKLEKVLSYLVPKLKYQAEDRDREQIIVQGAIALSTKRLLSDKYYYLNLKDELVVLDEPKKGTSFLVDECLYFAKAYCIAIFPIPQLEINDTVEYQGKQYIVLDIVYHYLSRAQMILGVKRYIEPATAPQEEQTVKDEELPTSKPVEGEQYFENPQKLEELSDNAKNHFIDVAERIYQPYLDAGKESEFQKIRITSAWRSHQDQYDILEGKLDKDMYNYYKSASLSAPYLKIIQYLYDGKYITMPEGDKYETVVPESDYMAIKNSSNREKFKKMIVETEINPTNKKEKAKAILKQSYVTEKMFNPSFHVSDIKNQGNALDIRFWGKYEETAKAFYDKHWELGYSRYPSSDHYHMTYRKRS